MQQIHLGSQVSFFAHAGGVGGVLVGGERLGGHARDGRREERLQVRRQHLPGFLQIVPVLRTLPWH